MAALWLIGVEEEPHQSAEICLFELKGYNVNKDSAIIGFGVHPFGDKKICDEFYEERFEIDKDIENGRPIGDMHPKS